MHNLGTLIVLSLLSLPAVALPHLLKIENKRDHILYLHSDALKKDVEIPPNSNAEIVIVSDTDKEGDWRFQYATGAGRAVAKNLDEKVTDALARCRSHLGELWKDDYVFVCKLSLQPVKQSRFWTSYILDIWGARDSHLPAGAIAEKLKSYQTEEGIIFSLGENMLEKALLAPPLENYLVEFISEVAEVTGLKAAIEK